MHLGQYVSVLCTSESPRPSLLRAVLGPAARAQFSRTLLEMQALPLTNSREQGARVRVRSGCERAQQGGQSWLPRPCPKM